MQSFLQGLQGHHAEWQRLPTQPRAVASSAFQYDGKVQGMYETDGSLAGWKTQEVRYPRGLIKCTDESMCDEK